jgi:hypothetical protein
LILFRLGSGPEGKDHTGDGNEDQNGDQNGARRYV